MTAGLGCSGAAIYREWLRAPFCYSILRKFPEISGNLALWHYPRPPARNEVLCWRLELLPFQTGEWFG
jgi:hypothetical protein